MAKYKFRDSANRPHNHKPHDADFDVKLPDRTLAFLNSGSYEGSRNTECHAAAQQLHYGGHSLEEALHMCKIGGQRCGLSEKEITDAVTSAYKQEKREPITKKGGTSLYPPRNVVPIRNTIPERSDVPIGKYDLSVSTKIPIISVDAISTYLKALFKPGERIQIVGADVKDGKETVSGSKQKILPLEEWLKIDAESGIDGFFGKAGMYVAINPLRGNRRANSEVAAYRHTLIESDSLTCDEQWNLIEQSKIPCSAIVYSGDKSVHAIVRVDAKDEGEYAERVSILRAHLAQGEIDKTKDAARLSRLAGAQRSNGNQQALLSVQYGLPDWDAWYKSIQRSKYLEDASVLIATPPKPPPELIEGLLHRSSKMVLGGGSKSFKTWSLTHLAIAVATGKDWWGFKTKKGRVAYLNFEVQKSFFAQRKQWIANAIGAKVEPGMLQVSTLRGQASHWHEIRSHLVEEILAGDFQMIIIDPVYKLMMGGDENGTQDTTRLMDDMERLAVETGAAVVFGAHFSKGNQAGKEAMDRISGSGVFARDPDTILTITPHEDDSVFTIDSILRNHPPRDQFCVKWFYPIMQVVDRDPEELKGKEEPKKLGRPITMEEATEAEILALFPDEYDDDDPWQGMLSAREFDMRCKIARYNRDHSRLMREQLIRLKKLVEVSKGSSKLAGKPEIAKDIES